MIDFVRKISITDEQEFQNHRAPWVLFESAGGKYALPSTVVQEMVPAGNVSALPNLRGAARGLMTLRDRTIPVIDLEQLLENGPPTQAAAPTVIVMNENGRRLGVVVEAVIAVEPLPKRSHGIMEAAPGLAGADTPVNGIARREGNGEFVLLLNPRKLLGTSASTAMTDAERAKRFD